MQTVRRFTQKIVSVSVYLFVAFWAAGCGRQSLPKLDVLIRESRAVYRAEFGAEGYFVVEILKRPPDQGKWPKVGDPFSTGLATLQGDRAKEIIIFVTRDDPKIQDWTHLGQDEIPLDAQGRLSVYRTSLPELRLAIRGK
ncbi:MAG: hypothetical protein C0518_03795 [Opitutus sp.]|nr:hypothetical protein [Opitutus sp.]